MKQAVTPSNSPSFQISEDLQSKIAKIKSDSLSENTKLNYQKDLKFIEGWKSVVGYQGPYTPNIIIDFIESMACPSPEIDQKLLDNGIKSTLGPISPSTLRRRVSALSFAHKYLSLQNPVTSDVLDVLKAICKRLNSDGYQIKQKEPIDGSLLQLLLKTCDNSPIGTRDRAILNLGFSSGGRRRSELEKALIADLKPFNHTEYGFGYYFTVRVSKTTKDGRGDTYPVFYEPALSLKDWLVFLQSHNITDGPLFRGFTKHKTPLKTPFTSHSIAKMIKRRAKEIGLNPKEFSGHSLRRGFVTEAKNKKISDLDVMAMTGHKSLDSFQRYYKSTERVNNPAAHILK